MIESHRLRVFRAVARHLNLGRAAEELLLTPPAVTQQIKLLEQELGVVLFDRRAGHLTLTSGGRALLPFAQKMKDLSEKAFTAVCATVGEQAGVLNLGASQTIGDYLLPTFVAGFLRAHPRVQVRGRSGDTGEMLQSLESGRIDMVLIDGPLRRKGLHVEPFMEDHLVLVVPATHEWADQAITLDAVKAHPLLMRESGSASRSVLEKAFVDAGVKLKELHISMELDSTEGLLSAVEAGLGVTFVSRWAVRNQLTLGTLKLAYVKGLKLARLFSTVYAAGPELSGPAGAFRRFLQTRSELAPRRGPTARRQ